MTTQPPQPNSKPARRLTPIIRPDRYDPAEGDSIRWVTIGIAMLISLGVYSTLGVLLLFIPFGSALGSQQKELTVFEGDVVDSAKKDNLTNDLIGLDPSVPEAFNVSRTEEVPVPGPVDPAEAIGVPNAPQAPPTPVPPPPGVGDIGSGGAIDDIIRGHGSTIGTAGGVPSILNRPGGFGGRSGATRQQMLNTYGGNAQSEAAVAAGLLWLARHQAPDGHWSLDNFRVFGQCNCTGAGQSQDIAATAFGLLPFLGAGETQKGNPDSHGKYRKNVDRGLKYLMLKQSLSGDFSSGGAEMYAHGLATIAICEAYGLTSDPHLKGAAQRALNFIARSQSRQGGWSYNSPCRGHDTSVGGWQLMALKSGQMAGLEVSNRTIEQARKWLNDVADPDGAGYGYQSKGATPTMTAVGLLCREYIDWGPRNRSLRLGVTRLLSGDNLPGHMRNMYYYYYATQVMHHFGGVAWEKWNPAMRDFLIQTQDRGKSPRHAHQYGSWDPAGDAWGQQGGRLMVTSLSVLTLEVYYRHLPLYQRDMSGVKK